MSELATYTFLPWLRQGIANEISGQTGSRATIPIDLVVKGNNADGNGEQNLTISKDIQIYGPGDITGIDKKAIVKVEPLNWITNFETNYLPYIEFYDEDFPWRYSPMPNPGNHRLLPWLALVVLKDDEFEDGKNVKDKPLPFIEIKSGAKLPDSNQAWAWSHVHVNRNLIDDAFNSTQTSNIGSKLEALLEENADLAYSRIVCPRKLEEKTGYHAFLVPIFDTGRLAGLGENPEGITFNALAWDANALTEGHQIPYYHRWYFRTGTVGDFEYLVRLLEPKPVDSRVGIRDMDVQQPGANLLGLRDKPGVPDEDKLNGILKLGGALRIPDRFYTTEEFTEVEKYRNWPILNETGNYPHPFQENMAAFINLTDSYEAEEAKIVNQNAALEQEVDATDPDTEFDIKSNPDPLITAPLYGRWHALTQRLLKERDNTSDASPNNNWVHQLNLDPQFRVPAGFGTKVIQENQEDYMKAAWDQVGEVLEANKRIREAQLAKIVSEVWYETHLQPIKQKYAGKWLSVAAPVHNRVVSKGLTVFYQKKESKLSTAVTSINMRKALRPRGKLIKRLPFDNIIKPDNLIDRINEGEVTAAPPIVTPEGIQTPEDIADAVRPTHIPDAIIDLLQRYPWIKWIPLILALVILIVIILFPPAWLLIGIELLIVAGLVYLYFLFSKWTAQVETADSILEENQTPESVDDLPNSPDFKISEPDDNFTPTGGATDSEEAKRFKLALKDNNRLIQESAGLGREIERPKLNIAQINDTVYTDLRPATTIPRWIFSAVQFPTYVYLPFKERFVEAMAYPKFDVPMYKPLAEYSSELLLPNINFIDQNSISLLETNQKFIEAYMVGLNHEFARELLWREYPTDQRGSYFRQFWDVSGFIDTQPKTIAALKVRFEAILNLRKSPELQEYLDRLNTPGPISPKYLSIAHKHLLKEELKDIKPLHYWSKNSDLGDHDNRELPGDNEEEVVLVIRGELLKKYPTAVIYAHKAVWNYEKDDDDEFVLDENGEKIIDIKQERSLALIPEAQEDNPPTSLIKSPLYEAKVEPDIYFFGFDLTVCEAKGGTGKEDKPVDERCAADVTWDDPGWFFVIKERPGEPRFGLDVRDEEVGLEDVKLWNDLSWSHVTPAVDDGDFLQITNSTQDIPLQDLADDGTEVEKELQKGEDANINWTKEMNSAELAYILYQVPVLVAIHACEMLPDT